MFNDISLVNNIYSQQAKNGIDWFLKVQQQHTKINHELNGQSYNNVGDIVSLSNLNNKSLFFGTPSRKFNNEQQISIAKDISLSMLNNIYDFAIIYQYRPKNTVLQVGDVRSGALAPNTCIMINFLLYIGY